MSLDMVDEEDGKDDYFLEMSHCGLGAQSGVKGGSLPLDRCGVPLHH